MNRLSFIKNLKPPRLSPLFYKRRLVFFATLLTGFASLTAQVVWQKYLAILVGSEARSMSLVVAVFLFGLASGYHFFGRLSEKKWSRSFLMKIYGYIELATALYFAVFYIYFEGLKLLSFNSPEFLLIDILVSFLALFLPTFLMGASIPLLTAVLPDQPEEVNATHAGIYGWNTLGAFFGTLISAFILLPKFGFALTLTFAGCINLLAGLIFIANPFKGMVQKKEDITVLPCRFSNSFLLLFVFLTGAVIISFEILFVRLLNMTIGAGVYNFPMVLSLFVGGLGLGSLLLPKKISPKFFVRQLVLSSFLLFIAFLTAPYWPIWLSDWRVSLANIPTNYYFYKTLVYLFLFIFIFPLAFFMGRLLPLSYSYSKKTKSNYGRVCGQLYFFNTLGTVFGSIVIGYIAFHFFNLDQLFLANLIILIGLAFYLAFLEKRKLALSALALISLGIITAPKWDRTGHVLGYFRQRTPQPYHFKGLFKIPKTYPGELIFFKDAPNSAVAVTEDKKSPNLSIVQEMIPSADGDYMVAVNAKAIGSLFGSDFSTIALLSSFGYLFAPERPQLSSAVIGLGTGFTAGLLGQLEEIKDVTVLEISSGVAEGVKAVSSYNLEVAENPKVNIIPQDAFRYFTKTKKKFDVIVSEPSNPWIIGVENLFALEFYELIQKKLNPGGVLVQWFHTYSINQDALKMVFHTLKKAFPFAELYIINGADILMISSSSPLQKDSVWKARFSHPVLLPIHKALGLHSAEDISLLKVFGSQRFSAGVDGQASWGIHRLTSPKLTYTADKAFFLGKGLNIFNTLQPYLFEPPEEEKKRTRRFKKYLSHTNKEITELCLQIAGWQFFCSLLRQNLRLHRQFKNKELNIFARFRSYSELRRRGVISYDKSFLKQIKRHIIKNKIKTPQTYLDYIHQALSNRDTPQVLKDLDDFEAEGLLGEGNNTKEFLNEYISHISSK